VNGYHGGRIDGQVRGGHPHPVLHGDQPRVLPPEPRGVRWVRGDLRREPGVPSGGISFSCLPGQGVGGAPGQPEAAGGPGLSPELLGPAEIRDRWPFVRVDDLLGGSFTAQDGTPGPMRWCRGWPRGEEVGCRVAGGCRGHRSPHRPWKGDGRGDRIGGVRGRRGRGERSGTAGCPGGGHGRVGSPGAALSRQIFFTDPFEGLARDLSLIIDLQPGWYMRREGKGLLLAGPQDMESSFNEGVDFAAKEWTAERSLHRVPILERARSPGAGRVCTRCLRPPRHHRGIPGN